MRGHGVMCNVHTYSALMNVCIKVSTYFRCVHFTGIASLGCSVCSLMSARSHWEQMMVLGMQADKDQVLTESCAEL